MPDTPSSTARHIFDHAPLGALIRYSDGTPRPPDRFNRKLSAWANNNATGRLMRKVPGTSDPYVTPDHFLLHIGDYGRNGIIVISMNRMFSVASALNFCVESEPAAGSVRVLQMFGDAPELLHLAASVDDAEHWLAAHPYSDVTLETVS